MWYNFSLLLREFHFYIISSFPKSKINYRVLYFWSEIFSYIMYWYVCAVQQNKSKIYSLQITDHYL